MQSLGMKQLATSPSRPARPAAPARAPLAKPATPLSRLPWLLPHAASFPASSNGGEVFVRPDVPLEEGVAGPSSRWPRVPAAPSSRWPRQPEEAQELNNIVDKPYEKVHFRSALEQVSYNTNKAMEEERPKKKGGLFRALRK